MLKCFATLLLVIAAVSGCYFPSDFTADLQIDRQGRYRFTYIGKLTDVSLARASTATGCAPRATT